jgi:hypothetical protein|eukprot:scaffold1772_cov185-Alexandrium_tamarense.AAC.2
MTCAHGSKVDDATNGVAQYEQKKGFGKIVQWGLAKVESLYDGVLVSDLISAFITKCDKMFAIMIHSFKDMTLSYTELHDKEVERLAQFDTEFKDLVKLRNKIDRKCVNSKGQEERSLCVDKGIEIHDKIQNLRGRRLKSAESIEWYTDMITWCASYKNWFC